MRTLQFKFKVQAEMTFVRPFLFFCLLNSKLANCCIKFGMVWKGAAYRAYGEPKTVWQCHAICLGEPNCQGFTFFRKPAEKKCILKAEALSPQYASRPTSSTAADSWVAAGPKTCYHYKCHQQGFKISGQSSVPYKYKILGQNTMDSSCQRVCQKDDKCRAFQFNWKNFECSLFDVRLDFMELQGHEDFIVGPKYCLRDISDLDKCSPVQ